MTKRLLTYGDPKRLMRGQTFGSAKKLQAGGESEVCCPYVAVTITGAIARGGYLGCPNCAVINGVWVCAAISPCEWVYEGSVGGCYIYVWVILSATLLTVWFAVGPTSSNTAYYGFFRETAPTGPCSSFNESLTTYWSSWCELNGSCTVTIPA